MLEFISATFQIFYLLGIILSITVPIIATLFWKRMTPPVLRMLWWAFRRREPLLLLCHDSGRSILTTIRERMGEGVVLTKQNKYKILPRFAPKLPFSEMIKKKAQELLHKKLAEGATTEPSEELPNGEMPEETEEQRKARLEKELVPPTVDFKSIFSIETLKENFLLDYSDFTNKRSNLVGLNLPVFVGYTGKLCLMNPEALALYEAGNMFIRTSDGISFNPNKLEDKSIEDAYQPLLLLDPRKIQEIIYKGFDQSQMAGVIADAEEIQRLKMQGGLGGQWGKILLLILLLCGGVGALLYFLSMGQAPPAIIGLFP